MKTKWKILMTIFIVINVVAFIIATRLNSLKLLYGILIPIDIVVLVTVYYILKWMRKKQKWLEALDLFISKKQKELEEFPKLMINKDFYFSEFDTDYSKADEYKSIRIQHPAIDYVTERIILPYIGITVNDFTKKLLSKDLSKFEKELVIQIGTVNAIVEFARTREGIMSDYLFDAMIKRYPAFVLLFQLNERQIETAIGYLSIINMLGKRDAPLYPLEKDEGYIPTSEYGFHYCLYGAINNSIIIKSEHGRTIWHVIDELEKREKQVYKHLRKQVKEKFAEFGQRITI